MATALPRPEGPEAAATGRDPLALAAEVERRLAEAEALPDSLARELVADLVGALVELYGRGLERIVEQLAGHDRDGALAAALTEDELVSHLLLLHGLHPTPLADRVAQALAEVRPFMESHGGDVELVAIAEPVVRVRLQGSCHGCPSSTVTLKLAIENAIHKLAPEIEEVQAEEPPASSPLLQIELGPNLVCPLPGVQEGGS